MSALQDQNERYRKVKVIYVDWDLHRNSPIASELKVYRQATLVMFHQGEEVQRLQFQTSKDVIEAMFKSVT